VLQGHVEVRHILRVYGEKSQIQSSKNND